MAKSIPLNKNTHALLTYKPISNVAYASTMRTVPLLAFELPEAAFCFPIIFPEEGNAQPHALLGMGNVNIFVNKDGLWLAPYLPRVMADYPFSLAVASSAQGDGKELPPAVAIDPDAPHFHQPDGEPLYDKKGNASALLQRVAQTLGAHYRRHELLEPALLELKNSNVLEASTVPVPPSEVGGKPRAVTGLRCADAKKVMALPDETLSRWTRMGLMEMLFAHWRSLRHLHKLLDHPSCPATLKVAATEVKDEASVTTH